MRDRVICYICSIIGLGEKFRICERCIESHFVPQKTQTKAAAPAVQKEIVPEAPKPKVEVGSTVRFFYPTGGVKIGGADLPHGHKGKVTEINQVFSKSKQKLVNKYTVVWENNIGTSEHFRSTLKLEEEWAN